MQVATFKAASAAQRRHHPTHGGHHRAPPERVSGTVTVTASATDNVGWPGCSSWWTTLPLGAEDTTSPYSVSWNTTTVANGAHTLTALARDAAGNTATRRRYHHRRQRRYHPPTVPSPRPSDRLGHVTLSANATDNVGVAGVQFRWTTIPRRRGHHLALQRHVEHHHGRQRHPHADRAARDAAGNTATSAPVTVTVANAAAPPAFVQVKAATPQTNQSSVAVTYTGAQTAGNTNILAIGWNNATSNITSVTDSAGNTYQLAVPTARGSGVSQAIYYATNIKAAAAGTNTVTVTFNTATPYVDVRALEYSGLDPVNPFDVGTSASGTGTSANSGTVTTTAANALIFGAGITTGGFSTAGTNFTTRIITVPDADIAQDRIVTSTGAYSATAPVTRRLGHAGRHLQGCVRIDSVRASTAAGSRSANRPVAAKRLGSALHSGRRGRGFKSRHPDSQSGGVWHALQTMTRWYSLEPTDASFFDSVPHIFRYDMRYAAPPQRVWESLASDVSVSVWGPSVKEVTWLSPRPLASALAEELEDTACQAAVQHPRNPARGAITIVIAEESDETVAPYADHLIEIPAVSTLLQPLLSTIPLQVFAASLAQARGYDVDKPRNLAKSVTVE